MNTQPLLDTYRRIQILNDLLLKYLDELIDAQDREDFKVDLPVGVGHAAAERRIETKDIRKAKYFEELKAELEEEHPAHMCRNNTCDIDAARNAGLFHYAASVLINATKCPATEKALLTLERAFEHTSVDRATEHKKLLKVPHTKCLHCNSILWGVGDTDDVVCGNCRYVNLVPAAIRHADALKEVREKLDAAPEYKRTCRWCGKADTEHEAQVFYRVGGGRSEHILHGSGPGCGTYYKAGFPGVEVSSLETHDWEQSVLLKLSSGPHFISFDWDDGFLEVSLAGPLAQLSVSRAHVIDVIKLICEAPKGTRVSIDEVNE